MPKVKQETALRRWRHRNGVTQKSIAEQGGLDPTRLSLVEWGLLPLHPQLAALLAVTLDLNVTEVIDGPDVPIAAKLAQHFSADELRRLTPGAAS